ncbi:MAG: hypothetical protein MN733_37055, partial [Nitrososphaera sp.]|nr:hypothetical protein [Nitrososphaera sp.]
MQEIFQVLTTAFTLSLNEQQFQDPVNRPRIQDALRALSTNAAKLETHSQEELSQIFDFLRRSLAKDAQEALRFYEQAQYQSARFTLHQLTENCFACHSKLPSSRQFDLGKRFIEKVEMETLPLKDRVRLEVAARQFDAALDTYEAIFKSPFLTAGEIDLMSAFEDYLKISIRVYNNFTRPITALKIFQQRSDASPYLRDYLVNWVKTLEELQFQEAKGDELAQARELIRNGQLQNRFPRDRQGLVHFIVASSFLHRYVATDPSNKTHLAEAHYLLGIAESYIRSSWISETEFFLETAIRLDPTSPFAEKAYTFLEEYVIEKYTGSSGSNLPSKAREHLEELHRL